MEWWTNTAMDWRSCWMLMLLQGGHIDLEKTVVTASTPIVVSINHQDSIAAVLGLRMQYRRFYELFMESTKLCDDDKGTACNFTCQSDVSRRSYSLHLHTHATIKTRSHRMRRALTSTLVDATTFGHYMHITWCASENQTNLISTRCDAMWHVRYERSLSLTLVWFDALTRSVWTGLKSTKQWHL